MKRLHQTLYLFFFVVTAANQQIMALSPRTTLTLRLPVTTEKITRLIKERLPEQYYAAYSTRPNYPTEFHGEGPFLIYHLAAIHQFWENVAAEPSVPQRYKDILLDPRWKTFIEYFILLHDIGKLAVTPLSVQELGYTIQVYPGHENVSVQTIQQNHLLADSVIDNGRVEVNFLLDNGSEAT